MASPASAMTCSTLARLPGWWTVSTMMISGIFMGRKGAPRVRECQLRGACGCPARRYPLSCAPPEAEPFLQENAVAKAAASTRRRTAPDTRPAGSVRRARDAQRGRAPGAGLGRAASSMPKVLPIIQRVLRGASLPAGARSRSSPRSGCSAPRSRATTAQDSTPSATGSSARSSSAATRASAASSQCSHRCACTRSRRTAPKSRSRAICRAWRAASSSAASGSPSRTAARIRANMKTHAGGAARTGC